ncbi:MULTISPECIES: amidase [Gordonia]|uniref:amidase n=1 Tax=Gordonia TaxID=2053 RepID=UPI000D613B8E|nr:amidase [Gordonia paraffinivorans]PWD42850.1 amidase [Gordonia paraffinivorans]
MSDTARRLSATELADAYRSGELTPETVAAELLDAIDEVDPSINAFCLLDRDTTIAQARESGERFRAGAPLGPLDGVPVSIKDLLLTKGWPTLRGSLMIRPDQMEWDTDAPAVARLREAGAVLLGKVTTPEFGWKGVTDSPRTGVTRNPWNTERTSGGSSGGSAAAVAAGLGPLSVGTDGGGSIRIPAAYCGIVGLKPTLGRVPMYPPSPFAPVAHVGPMTRTVADCAVLLDVLSGPDPRDWSALPPPAQTAVEAIADVHDLSGLRIGYSTDLGFGTNDAGVQANTDRAVSVLEQLGATVEKVDLGWDDPVWAYHVIWFAGADVVVRALGDGAEDKVDPLLLEALERHRDFTASDFVGATALRMEMGTQMGLFHREFDILVTPAMPTVAFEAGRTVPEGSASPDWTSWTPYTYPFNLTGQPAITVPSGLVDGLPTGVQFVGARHRDIIVLRVAAAYEAAAGFATLGDRA